MSWSPEGVGWGRVVEAPVALSEVVSALSFALDMTEDAVPGHALRSCLMGTRIGMALGLGEQELGELYYALLLKDIGCSSNAARMCQILGGDDRTAKRDVKTVDWTRPTVAGVKMAWKNALPGSGRWAKLQRMVRLAVDQKKNNAEMIGLRCERGAEIVRKIGLGEECANAIHSLDEHWNGSGYPEHLRQEELPVLARILGVAQHLDVFAGEQGREKAMETLRERSGRWFDPRVVKAAVELEGEGSLWAGCGNQEETRARVRELEPGGERLIGGDEVDRVCEAFADVVDAKSSFTYRHSLGVTEAAQGIARELGLTEERRKVIYRAALLHDVGKLGVSTMVLNKPGKLDEEEWRQVKQHPASSGEILGRIGSFAEIARIAANHHERLDGTGYPNRLRGDELSLEDRIVAVADMYGALSEDRPYRPGLPAAKIEEILRKEVPLKLDPECVEAVKVYMVRKGAESGGREEVVRKAKAGGAVFLPGQNLGVQNVGSLQQAGGAASV